MKELFIIQNQEKKEISYIEDGNLREFYIEDKSQKRLEDNIYVGKVTDVLNGLQAAFVDIGEDKNAFLHIRDVLPKTSNVTGNKQENLEEYKIKDYLKPGQMLLVQVKKDSNGTKGARVSTNIQISGSYIILLPENDFITISKKVEDKAEAERLKNIVKEIKQNKRIGIIIRTAAQGKSKETIENDFINVCNKLEIIKKKFAYAKKQNKPKFLQGNNTILEKLLLDLSGNLNKILVSTKEEEEEVKQILENIQIENKPLVQFENNIEDKYDLCSQIEKIKNRKIWLKCGGFITIDKTEALTAIDVNSGKFTGKKEFEKTVVKVNKEASIEIAKQLRLRDIGGIIVIEYIDVTEDKHRKEIMETLNEALKQDRAKTQIVEFTKLNLLEMTRKHMFSNAEE